LLIETLEPRTLMSVVPSNGTFPSGLTTWHEDANGVITLTSKSAILAVEEVTPPSGSALPVEIVANDGSGYLYFACSALVVQLIGTNPAVPAGTFPTTGAPQFLFNQPPGSYNPYQLVNSVTQADPPVGMPITIQCTSGGNWIQITSYASAPRGDQIVINTGAVGDTFNIYNYGSNDTISLNAGSGSDSYQIVTEPLFGVFPSNDTINVNAGSGSDNILVADLGDNDAISITAGSGNDTINVYVYGLTPTLDLHAGSGNDTINVYAFGDTCLVNVNAGSGNDTINVYAVGFTSDLDTVNIQVGSGDDVVSVNAGTPTNINLIAGSGNDNLSVVAETLSSQNDDIDINIGSGTDFVLLVAPNDFNVDLQGLRSKDTLEINDGANH